MNDLPDDQLDRLLTQWAVSRAANADDLAALRRRVGARLTAESGKTGAVDPLPRPASRPARKLAAALALAAAALAAIACWSWDGPTREAENRLASAAPDAGPPLPAADTEADRARLAAFRELFGAQFSWLVEQSNREELGILPDVADAQSAADAFVAVRLVLVSRPVGENTWNEVQTVNILARREELVEASWQADRQASLEMWAYPLDDDLIAIDLRFDPHLNSGASPSGERFVIESSSIQASGSSTQLQSFERGGVEYRLYQTADVLQGEDLG